METSDRPNRLAILSNDWGDRDDPDDHVETRLLLTPMVVDTIHMTPKTSSVWSSMC